MVTPLGRTLCDQNVYHCRKVLLAYSLDIHFYWVFLPVDRGLTDLVAYY